MSTVDILHFNDFHRRLTPTSNGAGGAAHLSTVVQQQRNAHPGAILVNLGDVAGDQSAECERDFDPIPQLFNHMGVEILALGNHEFEDSAGNYKTLREGLINPLKAQTLCANVTDESSGAPLANTKPYTIRQLNGVAVGFIGVVTQELTSALHPGAGAGIAAARIDLVLQDLVPKVRAEGAEAVVVMLHDGLKDAKAIARDVPGIDVVLAAHDHQMTHEPIRIDREDGTKTWVAEAGAYGMALGHVKLHVDDATRRVTSVEGRLIEVTPEVPADPAVQAIVDKWKPLPRAEHVPHKKHWETVEIGDLKAAFEAKHP